MLRIVVFIDKLLLEHEREIKITDVGKLWQLVAFDVYEKIWWIPKQLSEVFFENDVPKE